MRGEGARLIVLIVVDLWGRSSPFAQALGYFSVGDDAAKNDNAKPEHHSGVQNDLQYVIHVAALCLGDAFAASTQNNARHCSQSRVSPEWRLGMLRAEISLSGSRLVAHRSQISASAVLATLRRRLASHQLSDKRSTTIDEGL